MDIIVANRETHLVSYTNKNTDKKAIQFIPLLLSVMFSYKIENTLKVSFPDAEILTHD